MSDIQVMKIFDDRVVQQKPMQAANEGALNITNVNTAALSATAAQTTFQVQVPSETTFVDRHFLYGATCAVSFTVTLDNTGGQPAADGVALIAPGKNFALAPFPLTSLQNSVTATINDTTVDSSRCEC